MKYELIEIGVADFNIQAEHHSGLCLLFEPNPEHFKTLISMKRNNWVISNAAVTNPGNEGRGKFYYVPGDICGSGYGPRGQGAIIKPNPAFCEGGYWYGLNKHLKEVEVEFISFLNIVELYNVTEIEMIKIDTEGHDGKIINGYVQACSNNKNLRAKCIIFESNGLMSLDDHNSAVSSLQSIGYHVERLDHENMIARLKNP